MLLASAPDARETVATSDRHLVRRMRRVEKMVGIGRREEEEKEEVGVAGKSKEK